MDSGNFIFHFHRGFQRNFDFCLNLVNRFIFRLIPENESFEGQNAENEKNKNFFKKEKNVDSQISERVMKVVSEQLGIEPEKLTMDTSFINDLGTDSLDLVELVMAIEEEFQISIPEEAASDVQTIGDVVRQIEEGMKN